MKKTLVAIFMAAAMAVCFSSCTDEARCWQISYELGGVQITTYQWSTKADADSQKSALEERLNVKVKLKAAPRYDTAGTCIGANL